MAKELRTFTKEFKLEAVQLVHRSGKSQAQVARDLGIAVSPMTYEQQMN
jgi:transposase-like protein